MLSEKNKIIYYKQRVPNSCLHTKCSLHSLKRGAQSIVQTVATVKRRAGVRLQFILWSQTVYIRIQYIALHLIPYELLSMCLSGTIHKTIHQPAKSSFTSDHMWADRNKKVSNCMICISTQKCFAYCSFTWMCELHCAKCSRHFVCRKNI